MIGIHKAIHQLSASMNQEITVAIPVAPLVRDRVRALAKRWLPKAILVEGQSAKWQLFHDADLALCCAGTAVIELALAKTPIILGFKHDRLTNWLGQRVWRGFASIVNINANQLIHPEFCWANVGLDRSRQRHSLCWKIPTGDSGLPPSSMRIF